MSEVWLQCQAGLPPRSHSLLRQPPLGVLDLGLDGRYQLSILGEDFFPRLKPVMGQNFRNAKVGSLCSLQGFQSLASKINGFGVKRRGLGAPGFRSLPGEKGVTRQKNGKCWQRLRRRLSGASQEVPPPEPPPRTKTTWFPHARSSGPKAQGPANKTPVAVWRPCCPCSCAFLSEDRGWDLPCHGYSLP